MTVAAQPLSAREVLAASTFFKALPADALERLAESLRTIEVPAGQIVVWEGEPGDIYYLIAAGEVEIWAAKGKSGPRPQSSQWAPDRARFRLVGELGPGDGFGEMALLLGGVRHATAWAKSDLQLFHVDKDEFAALLNVHRGLALALEQEMTLRAVATSAGKASPFASLSPEALRWLALRLQRRHFELGQNIVELGEPGDALYIIQSGKVEVIGKREDGSEYQLVTLGPGQPFGEQALVSNEPRSATVRAIAPVEVLRLSRDDFESVLREHPERSDYFAQLTLQRQRPRRIEHWAMERREEGGKPVFILKDARHGRYLRLSEEGAFLWDLMDGERTVRDLAVAYYNRFGTLGLDAVMDVMLQLDAARFVHIQRPAHALHEAQDEGSTFRRVTARLLPWITRSIEFPHVDATLTRLYRYFFRPFFTWPAQILLFLVAAAGAVLFVSGFFRHGVEGGPHEENQYIVIAAIIVGLAIHLSLHELAHAMACKRFNREVRHAGVGWYFFLPIIWVDVSDMWLAGRGPRIAVAVAGPYANFVLSGTAMLLSQFVDNEFARSLLHEFASAGYVLGLLNLNPLMEFDGYYALADWLEVPNLRAKALAYLGSIIWKAKRTTDNPRLTRIFTAYGTLALVYTVFIAFSVLRAYEGTIQSVVDRVAHPLAGGLLGWTIAGVMCWLILRRAWFDLLHFRKEGH